MANGGLVVTARRTPTPPNRGRYFTLEEVADAYPVLTVRLLRRLIYERRIPFSKAGRRVVLAQADIDAYFEENRVERAG
jgi:excisionase family DNA binding protein